MGRSRRTLPGKKVGSEATNKPQSGDILIDATSTQWKLGERIGVGGFGEIFLASNNIEKAVKQDAVFVAKIEPFSSGPLFVEMNFYLRVAKEKYIKSWKEKRDLKHLGMPLCYGFGSSKYHDERFRFIILDRFGPDIGSIFIKNKRRFNFKTVMNLCIQVLDTLEFINYYGYVHADVKGPNLLLGTGEGGEDRVFLLDYGLACLYVDPFGRHKEYVEDGRRAHDGTLEYTSRDAHVGAHSRRGDVEVLGYNMVQWLSGRLPWESETHPEAVADAKNAYMSNIPQFIEECFPDGNAPPVLQQFLRYVAGLRYEAKPDYRKLRDMLKQALLDAGLPLDGRLDISAPIKGIPKTEKCRKENSDTENRLDNRNQVKSRAGLRKPCAPVQICDRRTRQQSIKSRTISLRSQEFDWVKVLQSHPERDAKPVVKPIKQTRKAVIKDIAKCLKRVPENPRANPTPAMLEIMKRYHLSSTTEGTVKRKIKGGVASAPPAKRSRVDETPSPCDVNPYTPAMVEVLRKKSMQPSYIEKAESSCSCSPEPLDYPRQRPRRQVKSRYISSICSDKDDSSELSSFQPIASQRCVRTARKSEQDESKSKVFQPIAPIPPSSNVRTKQIPLTLRKQTMCLCWRPPTPPRRCEADLPPQNHAMQTLSQWRPITPPHAMHFFDESSSESMISVFHGKTVEDEDEYLPSCPLHKTVGKHAKKFDVSSELGTTKSISPVSTVVGDGSPEVRPPSRNTRRTHSRRSRSRSRKIYRKRTFSSKSRQSPSPSRHFSKSRQNWVSGELIKQSEGEEDSVLTRSRKSRSYTDDNFKRISSEVSGEVSSQHYTRSQRVTPTTDTVDPNIIQGRYFTRSRKDLSGSDVPKEAQKNSPADDNSDVSKGTQSRSQFEKCPKSKEVEKYKELRPRRSTSMNRLVKYYYTSDEESDSGLLVPVHYGIKTTPRRSQSRSVVPARKRSKSVAARSLRSISVCGESFASRSHSVNRKKCEECYPAPRARREVSPSEVDFIPRLRSGKDLSDDFVILNSVSSNSNNRQLYSSMGRPLRRSCMLWQRQ